MSGSGRERDDWRASLARAYELAYWVLGEHDCALEAALAALAKLRVAASAQDRRLAYAPRGRPRAGGAQTRAFRTRVSHAPAHLLQRLVYVETERFELRQERHAADAASLLVRYVKHLVRITLRRNSFHVTLGLARLLHRYATSQALDAQALLMQDAARVPDDDYCRARKRQLMAEMQARFGERLRVVSAARGEQRFETRAPSPTELALLEESLRRCTPWDTACPLPERFDPHVHDLPELSFSAPDPDDEHPVEVKRMHAVLHPDCFRRLMRALRHEPPERHARVPCFAGQMGDGRRPPPRTPTPLRAEDYENSAARLSEARASWGGLLSVSVDGRQVGQLAPAMGMRLTLGLADDAELIEVCDQAARALAVCLLHDDAPAHQELRRNDGRTLAFHVQRDESGARVTVVARGRLLETLAWRVQSALAEASGAARARSTPLLAWTAVLCLALGVWWLRLPTTTAPSPQRTHVPTTPAPDTRTAPPTAAPDPDVLRGPALSAETRELRDVRRLLVVQAGGPDSAALGAAVRRALAARRRFTLTRDAQRADALLRVEVTPTRLLLTLLDPAGRELWRDERALGEDRAATARAAAQALEERALRAASRPAE